VKDHKNKNFKLLERERERERVENGKTSHVQGLEELTCGK
jgi:hypothetical protein